MIIKQKKGQTAAIMLVCLIVLAMFTFFGVYDVREISGEGSVFLDSAVFYWFLRGLCILLIPFVLFGFVWSLVQLFLKKPLLEITDEALIDYSSAISVGRIPWDDIEGVSIRGMYLQIKLKNPEKYLSEMNAVKRITVKLNKKMGYEYILITFTRFKKQAFDVLDMINERKPIPGFDAIKQQVEESRKNNFKK